MSGDVIVHESYHDGGARYCLKTVGRPDQISMVDYDDAVRHALGYAKSQHGRAWIAIDGAAPVLLTAALAASWTRA